MIAHEHIDYIIFIGVVIACADFIFILARIVIPFLCISIPLDTLCLERCEISDTITRKGLIGLGKDGI